MGAFLFYIKVSNGLVCAEMKISEVLKLGILRCKLKLKQPKTLEGAGNFGVLLTLCENFEPSEKIGQHMDIYICLGEYGQQ